MNRALLSLCLFGAALATANILIMQRPATCPSVGATIVAASGEPSSATVAAAPMASARVAQAEPAQAPKDRAVAPAPAKTEAAKPTAAKDADQTGSVDRKPQSKKSAPLAQIGPGSSQVETGDREEWAEVVLAAKVHSAASVSSPTVRNYRAGTRLKVIGRKSGWIQVADPTTADRGWIFEKYLTLKEGSGKKQAEVPAQRTAQAGSPTSDDPNLVAPAPPLPNARPYARKQGSRRGYRYFWPPAGLAVRIYPGW